MFLSYKMDDVKINLVINSKKLRNINQNAINIVLSIEDGLIRCDPQKQYLELNIVSWIIKMIFTIRKMQIINFKLLLKMMMIIF